MTKDARRHSGTKVSSDTGTSVHPITFMRYTRAAHINVASRGASHPACREETL